MRGIRDESWERDTSNPDYEPILDMSVEEWHLGDVIPSTYMENGIRKIYVRDESIDIRYKLINGEAQLTDIRIF